MQQELENKVYQLIRQLRSSHQSSHGSSEQRWIQQHLSTPELKKMIPTLSIIALHILSALKDTPGQTGIELAHQLDVTRGGVTRAAKKLLSLDLITAQKHPDNQKNIYYQLQPAGLEIARVHDQMHHRLQSQVIDYLSQKYSPSDLKVVANFLEDLLAAENRFSLNLCTHRKSFLI